MKKITRILTVTMLFSMLIFVFKNINFVFAEIEDTGNFSLYTGETITDVILGGNHSAAITSEGRIFTWGMNSNGQLGNGTFADELSPLDITSNFILNPEEKITGVNLGLWHSSAITSEGRLFTWGRNYEGQLGDGTEIESNIPTQINFADLLDGETITEVNMGNAHSSAMTSEGRVFTWGSNSNGQLGNGTVVDELNPIDISSNFGLNTGETITDINLGNNYSSAMTSEGRIFTWGSNGVGQLGDGTIIDRHTPTEITNNFSLDAGETITGFNLGESHSSAITSEGRIFTWGWNAYGRLGDGTTTDRHIPTEITGNFILNTGETITEVNLGGTHSAAITSEGRVFTWGINAYGMLGDGTTTIKYTPTEITSNFSLNIGETITGVSLGGYHSAAITSEERVFTWGWNANGRLGNGTLIDKNIPTEIIGTDIGAPLPVISLNGASTVYVEYNETYIERGATFTDSYNAFGDAIVAGDTVDSSVLGTYIITYNITDSGGNIALEVTRTVIVRDTSNISLNKGERIIEVSLGGTHSVAITSEGRVFTWGDDDYWQLGTGSSAGLDQNPIPIEITSNFNLNTGETITEVSLGGNHSSAITSEGRIFTWGLNGNGQLGDGTTTSKFSPTEITSDFDLNTGEIITGISLGWFNSSAITSDGRVFTWGNNDYGQLGNGTFDKELSPIDITNNFSLNTGETITEVILGYSHSLVITSEGRILTWGWNVYGGIGDGTTINRSLPTEITNNFSLNAGETITTVSLGYEYSSAITNEGRVFTWGYNANGQLGDGTTINRSLPTEITNNFRLNIGETITEVSLGGFHSSAITYEGRVFTWGENFNGQLGDGSNDISLHSTPVEITSNFTLSTGETIIEVKLGYAHSSAITNEGRIFTWGYNWAGQLGDGTDWRDCAGIVNCFSSNPLPNSITSNFNLNLALNVTLNSSLDTIEVGDVYIEQGVTVIGRTEYEQVISGEVDTSLAGRYVITYTITDEGLNETVITRIVNVVSTEPEFVLGDANTSIKVGETYIDGTCQIFVGSEQFDCTEKVNDVNTSVAGIYTITYSYTIGEAEYTHKRYVFVHDDNAKLTLYYRKEEEGLYL